MTRIQSLIKTNRSSDIVEKELEESKQRTRLLFQELQRSKYDEAQQRALQRKNKALSTKIMDRLERGWWVSGTVSLWWHCDDQLFIEPASSDELEILNSLADEDVVERGRMRMSDRSA